MTPTVRLFKGKAIDADSIAGTDGVGAFKYGRFQYVILSNDPEASDPPGSYEPLDDTGVVSAGAFPVTIYKDVSELDKSSSKTKGPVTHTPVEQHPGASPGGILVPGIGPDGKGLRVKPGTDCSGGDSHIAAAGTRGAIGLSKLAQKSRKDKPAPTGSDVADSATPAGGNTDEPALAAVKCWTTPLDEDTKTLVVHIKDVGLVYAPRPTGDNDGDWKQVDVHGYPGWETNSINATVRYGEPFLINAFDITVEGRFPSGTNLSVSDSAASTLTLTPIVPSNHWSQTLARTSVSDDQVSIQSPKSGARMRAGRLFMRRIDVMPNSCDMKVIAEAGKKDTFVNGNQSMEVEIASIEGSGKDRVAHMVMRNGLANTTVPLNVLVDWVEQYRETPAELPKSLSCTSPVLSITSSFGN
jgi:hypothetical protein